MDKDIPKPKSAIKDVKDFRKEATLPSFNPDELLGKVFTIEHAGELQKAEVKELNEDKTYLIEYADGNEDNATYAELINLLNKEEEEGHPYWTFSKILDHRTVTNEKGKQ